MIPYALHLVTVPFPAIAMVDVRREIALMDFVEDCASEALGPAAVLPFLQLLSGRGPETMGRSKSPSSSPFLLLDESDPLVQREAEVALLAPRQVSCVARARACVQEGASIASKRSLDFYLSFVCDKRIYLQH